MNDYSQPNFYHFSEDSTYLANYILKNKDINQIQSILDIGAGCGVIGIEIARKMKEEASLLALEPQIAFNKYLEINKKFLSSHINFEIHNSSIGQFESDKIFDLVVSNPPYFEKGRGRRSHIPERQICRTFELDSLEIFIQKISSLFSPRGIAVIVFPLKDKDAVKSFESHGFTCREKRGEIGIFESSHIKVD